MTLGQVLSSTAEKVPDKVALIWGRTRLTYSQTEVMVNRIATGLIGLGVEPGDRVGLLLDKCPELVLSFLACARIGAIVAPLNFKLKTPELRKVARDGEMSMLVIGSRHRTLATALGDVIDLKRCVYLGPTDARFGQSWAELSSTEPMPIRHVAKADDAVYLNYTSGSTGRSKGAITSHRHLQANALGTINKLGMQADDVFMGMFTAFSHPHELFHRTLNLGATAVLLESWNPRIICQAIAKYRVTWMMAVPSLYTMMLAGSKRADLSSLRCLEAGGAYVSAEEVQAFEASFGVPFVPVWGSTETVGVAIALTPGGERPSGSIGRAVPGYDFEIRDDDGLVCEGGQVGHMWVRGEGVIAGYLGLDAGRQDVFDGAWYRTGDLVRVDEKGFFHFVSRESDMLKVGGLRVYPLEVELALRLHPLVSEAVVIGSEDRLRGQIPRAVVCLKPGLNIQSPALRLHCLEQLAVYKVPRSIDIWSELPLLPNGKVDRKAVTRRLLASAGQIGARS